MATALPETVRIEREHIDGDRYQLDFSLCHFRKGWAQCDTKQDASYYGTWANPLTRQVVCFCEGDVTTYHCDTAEDFAAVVRELARWCVEYGYGWNIDHMCRPEIEAAFIEAGLGDLLYQ